MHSNVPDELISASEEALPNMPHTGGYDTATLLGRMIQQSERTNALLETIAMMMRDMQSEVSSLRRLQVETAVKIVARSVSTPADASFALTQPKHEDETLSAHASDATFASSNVDVPPAIPRAIGRPVGRPRTSLATSMHPSLAAVDATIKYYYPASKSLTNKYMFMAAIMRHVMEAVTSHARREHHVDYIDTRIVDASTLVFLDIT
jgi:hypothetical protein